MAVAVSPNERSHQSGVVCPLYCERSNCCQCPATVTFMWQLLCQTNEHDACPLYLSYLLRRTRMLRCDNDWLDAS